MKPLWVQRYVDSAAVPAYSRTGTLVSFNGLVAEALGPHVPLGTLCHIRITGSDVPVAAEVIGFREGRVLLMPFGSLEGAVQGALVTARGSGLRIPVARSLLGRVVDALGTPIDAAGAIAPDEWMDVRRPPLNPLERIPLDTGMTTGVRALDGMLPLARGQRVGIFAGSGVGKSTLLGMLANRSDADVIVVAMVGERGREVRDFLEQSLDADGRARTVTIVATADQPALLRAMAVHTAHAVAEYFRSLGSHVLLIVDSMTRFAMAQREIGVAAGEPPTSRGYPPSVFNMLPMILERGGRIRGGASISAIYSVLVEGDDMNDPVADHMRAILDGHIVLSRDLAVRGQLPPVDVLASVSRLASQVTTMDEREMIKRVRLLMAMYEASRDLIDMGGYQPGANATLDAAVEARDAILEFLNQRPDEHSDRAATWAKLADLAFRGNAS
jgi:flagellum-specific ATP synthase